MNAEEFLKTKGIGKPTIKAVRLPHKYKNIELELIPLMEEYAELKLLSIADVSDLCCVSCGYQMKFNKSEDKWECTKCGYTSQHYR
jgi:ribosomal protein S27AE